MALPNGVDLAHFEPHEHFTKEEAILVVSGKMSYHVNATMGLHLVK